MISHVDPKRVHLAYGGSNVLRVETARKNDWNGGGDLARQPPIGTHSGPARDILRIAVNQDSQRRPGTRVVAIDLGQDVRRFGTGSRPQGFQRRNWQVPQHWPHASTGRALGRTPRHVISTDGR